MRRKKFTYDGGENVPKLLPCLEKCKIVSSGYRASTTSRAYISTANYLRIGTGRCCVSTETRRMLSSTMNAEDPHFTASSSTTTPRVNNYARMIPFVAQQLKWASPTKVRESGAQPRFQSWGSNSLVYGITTLLQKKLDRSTQFRAVGYIITLYSSKSSGVRQNFMEVRTSRPPVVAPMSKISLFWQNIELVFYLQSFAVVLCYV